MNKIFWIWLVGVLALTPLAYAQSPSFEELTGEGLKAYEDGDYDLAIKRFMQARTIQDSSDLVYNIARAYHKKGECEAAKRHYNLYIKRDDGVDEEGRQRAQDHIDSLGECATTGTLLMVCTPADAHVSIDGGAVEGPCGKFEGLSSGQHVLIITAKDHQPIDERVEIAIGKIEAKTVVLKPMEKAIPKPPVETSINWLGWGLTGGGVLLLGGALLTDVLNLNNQEELKELPQIDPDREEIEESYRTHQKVIWILGGAGIATLGTGIAFLLMDIGGSDTDDSQTTWTLLPNMTGDIGGTFLLRF